MCNFLIFFSLKIVFKGTKMTEYRDEKLVAELEKEIQDNECGIDDLFWCCCCGVFGLICIVPKYNKRKLANDRLIIELQKPKYNPNQAYPGPQHPQPMYVAQAAPVPQYAPQLPPQYPPNQSPQHVSEKMPGH